MQWELFLCLLFFIPEISAIKLNASKLPALQSYIDDYSDCVSKQKVFCEANVKLIPVDEQNEHWKVIEQLKKDPTRMDRSHLQRVFCIDHSMLNHSKEIEDYILSSVKKEVDYMGLEPLLTDLYCNQVDFNWTYLEYGLILFWTFFITLVTTCTLYNSKNSKKNRWIPMFSLKQNWEDLIKPDNGRLRSINTLKVLYMILIVIQHSGLRIVIAYHQNPEFFERDLRLKLRVNAWSFYMVQTFFVFSGWLMAVQVLDKFNNFSLKQAGILLLKRFFRLQPLLLLVLLFQKSKFSFSSSAPRLCLLKMAYDNCQERWWKSLFFLSNLDYSEYMCYVVTWYLAADTQLYVVMLLLFYVMFKFRLRLSFLSALLALSWTGHLIQNYLHDSDLIYKPSIEKARNITEMFAEEQYWLYLSTLSNSSTYLVGVIIGSIYHKNKDKQLFSSQAMKAVWFFVFIILPHVIDTVSTLQFQGWTRYVIGATLKPLYGFALAFGVLGISFGVSRLKGLFESRFMDALSKITYSVYLGHFGILFKDSFNAKDNIVLSYYYMVESMGSDILMAFGIGFLLYMFFEAPFRNLGNALFKPKKE